MNPVHAQRLIETFNGHSEISLSKKEQTLTALFEVTDNGLVLFSNNHVPDKAKDTTRRPGEYIVFQSYNSGIAHKLGALAELGYLYSDSVASPALDAPRLELISYSTSGTLAEAVFRDHNPRV